ncbi:hypothetical protein [Pseudomonas sp. NBRC 111123]|nr:hypothetical protein [Pseudomonas sp. NBRC 111123]
MDLNLSPTFDYLAQPFQVDVLALFPFLNAKEIRNPGDGTELR